MVYRYVYFFFNNTPTTEIYTLSLHDALPISSPQLQAALNVGRHLSRASGEKKIALGQLTADEAARDRKSTRLNSSHQIISYAVFCLKKKKLNFLIKSNGSTDVVAADNLRVFG